MIRNCVTSIFLQKTIRNCYTKNCLLVKLKNQDKIFPFIGNFNLHTSAVIFKTPPETDNSDKKEVNFDPSNIDHSKRDEYEVVSSWQIGIGGEWADTQVWRKKSKTPSQEDIPKEAPKSSEQEEDENFEKGFRIIISEMKMFFKGLGLIFALFNGVMFLLYRYHFRMYCSIKSFIPYGDVINGYQGVVGPHNTGPKKGQTFMEFLKDDRIDFSDYFDSDDRFDLTDYFESDESNED